jgi:outer membrane protein
MNMKNFIKIVAVFVILITFSSLTHAQNPVKIGYIDFNTLITAMPGVDSVKIKLQKYQQSLSDQMDAMGAEFENKYMDYQSKSAGMSDLIKQTKEKELTDLQSRIDAFKAKAQQDFQAKQQELLQPIVDKAKAAIKDVARENKYTYVINAIEDIMLYSEPGDDIMGLVKKKLGIQ